ncbi:MAG: M20 family metallopeptidase [Bacilli bacterium]
MRDMLSALKHRQADMEDTLYRLMAAESPSNNKRLVDRCGEILQSEFQRLAGGSTEKITQPSAGDQYRFTWGGGEEQILIVGHFDTVWDEGALDVRREGGKLWGPGAFDMKGGLTVTLWALWALRTAGFHPQRKVVFLCTSDEEVGSHVSRSLIEQEARKSVCVLVPESSIPPFGGVKTARKGIGDFTMRVQGIPAHAGVAPLEGVSAIEELAMQILDLKGLQDVDAGVSVNVGVIRGGTRPNVKAEFAEGDIDVRFETMAQAAQVSQALLNRAPCLPRARVSVEGGINRPPFERSPAVAELYEAARKIAERHGYELSEGRSGGGSDGNFAAALGIPTLDGLGPLGDGAHARSEHVVLANLPVRAALIAELVAHKTGGMEGA